MKIFSVSILCLSFMSACNYDNHSAERLEILERDGLYGFQNLAKEAVIAPQYYAVYDFNQYGVAAVLDSTGWSYINTKGELIIRPLVFDNGPDYFVEGLARFKTGDKLGFFDERGQVVIAARFDFASPFSNGLAAVCNECTPHSDGEHSWYEGGKWGYIGHGGDYVIAPQYEKAEPFNDGRARVYRENRWLYIDKQGQILE